MYVNLLPRHLQSQIQFRAAFRRWRLIWGAAALCCFAMCALQVNALIKSRSELEQLDLRCQPFRKLKEEIQTAEANLGRLREERTRLERFQPPNCLLELFAVLTRANKRLVEPIHLQKMSFVASTPVPLVPGSQRPNAAPAPSLDKPVSSLASLALHGTASNDGALSQFVSALRESQVFAHVDLRSSSQSGSLPLSRREYHLECRFGE